MSVVGLQITRAGEKIVDSLKPLVVDTLNEALDGFTRKEVRELEDRLRRISQRLRETAATKKADEEPM